MASSTSSTIFRRSNNNGEPVVIEDSHASGDLSNYNLIKSVGVGAYAKVYKAEVKSTGAHVAAKIISKTAAPSDYVKKFLPREIAVLQKIENVNCVTTYEIFEVNRKIHIIMELAPNGDLLDYINSRGRIAEPSAQKLFGQLVGALDYFYSMNIAHRDLKCENLLLDGNFNIKVSDFGFATPYSSGQMLRTFCGSIAYACPEILYGQPYDGRFSDLWSIGVVLYALVCGQLPFQEGDMKRLLMQINSPLALSGRLTYDCADLLRKILATPLRQRATLADVKRHAWLKPPTASPVVKHLPERSSMSPRETFSAKPARYRSSTIDGSELGGITGPVAPLVVQKASATPPASRCREPQTPGAEACKDTAAVTGETAPESKAVAATERMEEGDAVAVEVNTETRSRSMTGTQAAGELSRHMSWRKRLRQNLSNYMSPERPEQDAKKGRASSICE